MLKGLKLINNNEDNGNLRESEFNMLKTGLMLKFLSPKRTYFLQ